MNRTDAVLSTLDHVRKLTGTMVLVKLGGASLADLDSTKTLFEDLVLMRSVGMHIVLVHGGGPSINAELTARNIPWEFIDGQRVTTPEIMEVVETVLCGVVNRKIVRALNFAGAPAVGFSGIEAATLKCRPASPKLGQVGIIDEVDGSLIQSILRTPTSDGRGAIPVIAPIGIGSNGETFNVNADWAASRIAQALKIRKVIFLTDQPGILDPDKNILSELDASELEHLIETRVVTGGMLTKAQTIAEALRNGIAAVHVLNCNHAHALAEELFTETGVGTLCRTRSRVSALLDHEVTFHA